MSGAATSRKDAYVMDNDKMVGASKQVPPIIRKVFTRRTGDIKPRADITAETSAGRAGQPAAGCADETPRS